MVERNDAFALKEATERIEQLEQQLASKEKAMSKMSSVDCRHLAENVLKSIEKQFQAQMLPEKDLSENQGAKITDKSAEGGREVVAIIPNITSEIMTELGLQYEDDGSIKQKSADYFFRSRPMKTLPGSGGACLRLGWNVNFKYTKVSSELKVTAYYKWSAKPKPKAKAKSKAEPAVEEAASEVKAEGQNEAGEAEEAAAKVAPSPAKSPTPARAAASPPVAEAEEAIDVE